MNIENDCNHDRKINYEYNYVPCRTEETVDVYIQGWYCDNISDIQWIYDDKFTLIKLPVFSTVADLIKYVETERWRNQYKIHCTYQTSYFKSSIADFFVTYSNNSKFLSYKFDDDLISKANTDNHYKFYDFPVLSNDQLLPFVSHWDCYWNLDSAGIGYLFRLNKDKIDFDNTFPQLLNQYQVSMQKFLEENIKLNNIELIIQKRSFHINKEVCSVRSSNILHL